MHCAIATSFPPATRDPPSTIDASFDPTVNASARAAIAATRATTSAAPTLYSVITALAPSSSSLECNGIFEHFGNRRLSE